jgi:hypothetical protein
MHWFGLLFFVAWLIVFSFMMLGLRQASEKIRRWAERNGLRVVDSEQTMPFGGPFAGTTSSQTLYRVVFEDRERFQRSAWVRCGSPFLGSWSDLVEVRWDDERPADSSAGSLNLPSEIRRRRRTVWKWSFRYLPIGSGIGLGVGVILLQSAGGLGRGTTPFLAIATFIGAIVGLAAGCMGGFLSSRGKPQFAKKTIVETRDLMD